MKLTDKQGIKYLNFLNNVKGLMGLGDWTIKLNTVVATNLVGSEPSIATCVSNHYEKIIEIQLTNEFLKSSEDEQNETLIHELVHSRFQVYSNRIRNYAMLEEEYFVNDVSRGLMKLL